MHTYKLAILAALGGCALVSCGDDGGLTTETTGAGGTGTEATSDATTTPTTDPTTTPTTGVDTTGPGPTTGPGTTESPDTTESPGTTDNPDTTESPDTTTSGTTEGDTTEDTTDGTTTDTGTGGVAPTCEDGVVNQDESDIDCGGDVCPSCQTDQLCNDSTDCASEACVAGVCVMPSCQTDLDCIMLEDQCNTGVCNLESFTCEAMPAMDGLLCDDDDLCTLTSTCMGGSCEPGAQIDCAAQNGPCTIGVCDPEDGLCKAEIANEGMACNDNNACSVGETCQAGVCGDPDDPGYVFHEDFNEPDPGWVLDTNWEIGAAKLSPVGTGNTGTDPALDHTGTNDNKLAGQLIGGLIDDTIPLGVYRCLTTPKVDTSMLPTVWVTFWRHLHSDYADSWAINRIEVWNGAQWMLVEQGYNAGQFVVVNDLMWKEVKFDLTTHKNKDMQVRICHNRVSNIAYDYGGWSVDDVTIAPVACTP